MPVIEAARLCDRASGRPDPRQGDRRPPGGGKSGHAFKPRRRSGAKGTPRAAFDASRSPGSRSASKALRFRFRPGFRGSRRSASSGEAPSASAFEPLFEDAGEGQPPPRADLGRARDRQDPAFHPRAPWRRAPGRGRALRGCRRGARAPLRPLGRGAFPLRRTRPRAGPCAHHVERHGGELARLVPALRDRLPDAAAAARDRPRHRALPALGCGRRPAGGGLGRGSRSSSSSTTCTGRTSPRSCS